MTTKLVIIVSGGVAHTVYCSKEKPPVQVKILDSDSLKNIFSSLEVDKLIEKETKGMYPIDFL